MQEKITRWGIGPKFAFISVMYSIAVLILDFTYMPALKFILIDRWVNIIIGTVLIMIGMPIWIVPAFTIDKFFRNDRLCTAGIYSYIRHPIYGAGYAL